MIFFSRIVIFCLIARSVSAQNLVYKGKIIDAGNGNPVEFASIIISNSTLGTLSNEFGEFVIKAQQNVPPKLVVACIGYKKAEFQLDSNQNYLLIKLIPVAYKLNEVVVSKRKKGLNAKQIVKNAIEKLLINAPDSSFGLKTYYREYIKHDSLKYINLLEAQVSISDPGSKYPFDKQKISIESIRLNNKHNRYNELATAYTNQEDNHNYIKQLSGYHIPPFNGNELVLLLVHNCIRRYDEHSFSFVNVLKKDFTGNHRFKLDSVTEYNGEQVYCIDIDCKLNEVLEKTAWGTPKLVKKYNFKGKMIITKQDYRILKFTYSNPDSYEIIIEQRVYKNKCYQNYLSFSNYFTQTVSDSMENTLRIPIERKAFTVKKAFGQSDDKIVIKFNKPVDNKYINNTNNYILEGDFYTFGKKVIHSISPVRIINNPSDTSLILFLSKGLGCIDTLPNHEACDLVNKVVVKNIKDIFGNEINEIGKSRFVQCREIFTTEIVTNNSIQDMPNFVANCKMSEQPVSFQDTLVGIPTSPLK